MTSDEGYIMYCLSIKKDDEKEGYLYFGIPVGDLKSKFDILRFTTDEKYYDENIEALIQVILNEAENQTEFNYDEASLFGFVEGHAWIHCRISEPTEANWIRKYFNE